MSRETFAIEWNIARAALKGILKLHPLTVQKWEADVLRWHMDTIGLPPAERSRARSKTFHGIAKAMAEQWG